VNDLIVLAHTVQQAGGRSFHEIEYVGSRGRPEQAPHVAALTAGCVLGLEHRMTAHGHIKGVCSQDKIGHTVRSRMKDGDQVYRVLHQ
jgi:hypothetical protein